jgi:aspartyl-tRNA(Asn)/glutamyl-tRNA(Gln) amidotransferase subunit B
MTDVLRTLKERAWSVATWSGRVPAARLGELVRRVAARELPGPLAKQVFAWMCDEDGAVAELLERHGVRVQASADDLLPLVREVLDENPGPVAQVLAGKQATFGFLVGQVMKKSGGQAVPQTVQELLRRELAARATRG